MKRTGRRVRVKSIKNLFKKLRLDPFDHTNTSPTTPLNRAGAPRNHRFWREISMGPAHHP